MGKPGTVRELAARILVMVPCQYEDIYIACDTYEENSIKGENERPEEQVNVIS